MRRALLLVLLLPALAAAQDGVSTAPARDAADLVAKDTPIWIEAHGMSDAARRIAASPVLALVDPAARERIGAVLGKLAGLEIGDAALGVSPAIVFATRWIVLARTPEQEAIAAAAKEWLPEEAVRVTTAPIPPFIAIADSPTTIAAARKIADGLEPSLSSREDFAAFRDGVGDAALLFHLDVRRLAPIRPGLNKKDDVGAVFFAQHLLHVAKTARTLSGVLRLDGLGATLDVTAAVDPIPEARAFTETRPEHGPLTAPAGCAARISLTRDLATFWNQREVLLGAAARAPLAEFQNNLNVLMGGLSVEDVFAGLGPVLDLYVCRGDPAHEDGRRYPAAAIVATLRDGALGAELPTTFQTTIGIVNAQRAMQGEPRFFQEPVRHRDVTIAAARILPESVPDAADERLQFAPALAVAGGRMILGTNLAVTKALLDQALDGATAARAGGDEIEVLGPAAAILARDAAALLRSRLMLEEARTEKDAQEILDVMDAVLSKADRVRLAFDVEDAIARLTVEVRAPGLLPSATESRGAESR